MVNEPSGFDFLDLELPIFKYDEVPEEYQDKPHIEVGRPWEEFLDDEL